MNDDNTNDARPDEASPAAPGRHAVPYYHSRVPYSSGGSPGVYGGSGGGMYGASPYNMPAPYGAYGQGQQPYGGPSQAHEEEASMFGNLSVSRILRVCRQRWMTIAVFVAIGAAAAFVVFKIWTPIYSATATFELVAPQRLSQSVFIETGRLSFEEQANTTMFRMQQAQMVEAVWQTFQIHHPASTVTKDQILGILGGGTKMDLRRGTRLIDVTMRSTDRELASQLVNAFVQTTETYSQNENRAESEKGVQWLENQRTALKIELDKADKELADFKLHNTTDIYIMQRDALAQAMSRLNSEMLTVELALIDAHQLNAFLQDVNKEPSKFVSLPDGVPRMEEMLGAYRRLTDATSERTVLLTRLTELHPDVQAITRQQQIYAQAFSDVLFRAMEASAANVGILQRRYDILVEKQEQVNGQMEELQARIDVATSALAQLVSRRDISSLHLQNILKRIQEASLALDQGMSGTLVRRLSSVPERPIEPQAKIILPAGVILGLVLGFIFVLLLDHLEDQVTSIADIEQRLRLKTLAIVPHVRWKTRWEIALASAEDKFSHFAESFAGLRNLLESPRYREFAHVIMPISTQPSEGKTITACNLALSYAISGKKVLLVDFDLRRPRQSRIFKKNATEFTSLAEVLMKGDRSLFNSLVVPSGYENLSLVLSKPSSKISPASLMGTGILNDFFIWARRNFDKVIIDSPPFGIVSDTVALGSLADCVLMLACPNRSHFRPLRHAVRYLTEAGTRIIGAVINDVDFGHGSAFAGYDYHYRYAYQYRGKYKDYLRQQTPADEDDKEDPATKEGQATAQAPASDTPAPAKTPPAEKKKERQEHDDDADE